MITKKMWFKSKRYGWGWTPVSWEGWSVLLVYGVGLWYLFWDVDNTSLSRGETIITQVLPFIVLTALFIGVCYLTGEKPRFRWGK